MIPNPLQPSLEKASRHSMAVNENQNDVLMELLLSFVKSHDSSWFPQQFYRQLMILLTSTTVHMQWILNYSPNSFECLSSEHFVVYLRRTIRRTTPMLLSPLVSKSQWRLLKPLSFIMKRTFWTLLDIQGLG